MAPGVRIDEKVQKLIQDAHVVVVLNTATSSRSRWVQQEIGAAKALSKLIVPLKTRGSKLAAMLEGCEYYEFKASDPDHDFYRVACYLREYATKRRIKVFEKPDPIHEYEQLFQLAHLPQAMLCPGCKTVDVHVFVCLLCGEWVCPECGETIPYESTADAATARTEKKRTAKKRTSARKKTVKGKTASKKKSSTKKKTATTRGVSRKRKAT